MAHIQGNDDGSGFGVEGTSQNNIGVLGSSNGGKGVTGVSVTGTGVFGTSTTGEAVHGETNSTAFAAVAGIELNPNSNIAAVYGEQRGNGPALYGNAKGNGAGVFGISAHGPAGFFQGDLTVTGVLTANGDVVCTGGDCAEDFDVLDSQRIAPGTVMVLLPQVTL